MDTSELYIKMSDHPLIQDVDPEPEIDWMRQGYCNKHKCLTIGEMDGVAACSVMKKKVYDENPADFKMQSEAFEKEDCQYSDNWIYLPFQDQLQGMLDDTEDRKLSRLEKFTDIIYLDHWKPWGLFETFEQLWLAFVMSQLHKKKWTGTAWG